MTKYKIFVVLLFFILIKSQSLFSQSELFNADDYQSLDRVHDIPALHAWGPYSKNYTGISHIPDLQKGLRFDITTIPGFYRNRVMVPNVLFESGYFPWYINADMTRISYRYELEWKDRVYVDAAYHLLDSASVLVEMQCVNNTDLPQVLQLNLLANLNYPEEYPEQKAVTSENVRWINAMEYKTLEFATQRASDHLVYNGWLRGEERNSYFLNGRGLGKDFAAERGDRVVYTLDIQETEGILVIYYKLTKNKTAGLRISGLLNQELDLEGTGKFEMARLAYTSANIGKVELIIESVKDQAMQLNGFFIGTKEDINNIVIHPNEKNIFPEIEKQENQKGFTLKYPDIDQYYGMAWNFSPSVVREILDDELDNIFRKFVHEHNYKIFYGDSLGHYTNAFMRPVELKANTSQTIYALLKTGEKTEVDAALVDFNNNPETFVVQKIPENNPFENILPEGEKYCFSQKMMRAALLSNIVYPIYTQNQYIRHFTPGKWWNSLYTWDAGFIALGLAEIDIEKSIQCLNAYTTPVGSQSAFIHHGSLVPVQMYAFYDLWNKTQSEELLRYFYPRLKKYYEFLSGKTIGSTIREFNSNLLKTWEYFYNSGGWDDYPPQKAVRDSSLEKTVSPVITTAHCLRVAKILRQTALELGYNVDLSAYENDIKVFSNALQKIAWDEESGYFSYMVHDAANNPVDIFRYAPSGQNYNMGLDGAYPLFSGICTEKQQEGLLGKIFSEEHMWTPAGICVVDKEADYYRNDGYWNGAVWMPHQWFMWKTMLDLGRTDLAFRIADTALELWKKETDETYFTYEHFIADIARGAGWHQFGALSAPVLNWFAAYYQPGTITAGFEVWINMQKFDPDSSGYTASIAFDKLTKAHVRSLIVCLNPAYSYTVKINHKPVDFTERFRGLLEISLPSTNADCELEIKKVIN